MEYQPRVLDQELDQLFSSLPAIAIEGPKAVGKTETALRRARTVYRLDDPAQLAIAEADPARLASGEPPILVDEWQRAPASWDTVRRAVDRDASAGQFLLTGSASPTQHPTHSGAGRIPTVRMRPLSVAERGLARPTVGLATLLNGGTPAVGGRSRVQLETYVDEIVRSGFPAIRRLEDRALRTQLDGYITRIVERDFEALGHRVRNAAALRRWMTAYAAAISTTTSFETIRAAAAGGENEPPAKTTTIPYHDILEQLWIIDEVPAWTTTRNRIRRLTQSPKHQLADPALAARLLGVGQDALLAGDDVGPPALRDGPLLGNLFESLATLSVRVYAQSAEARVAHLRTRAGEHDVDLIIERADGRVIAAEIKLTRTIDDDDCKHLRWLRQELGEDFLDGIVINTGPEAYRRPDDIAVVPLALLGP